MSKVKFGIPAAVTILDALLFLTAIYFQRDVLTPSRVIATFAVTALPGFITMMIVDRGRYVNPKFFEWAELKVIVREAMPVVVALMFVHVHDKIDALMISWFSPQAEVGIFGAAYVSLAPLTGTFPMALTMAVIPVIAKYAVIGGTDDRKIHR